MTTTRPLEVNSGTTTSWIPFETAGVGFAPACSSALVMVYGNVMGFEPWEGDNAPYTIDCLPTEVVQSLDQDSGSSTVLSLGPFHCPSAYSTATASAVNSASTSVICCPSQYGLTNGGADPFCVSTLTAGSLVAKSMASATWVDATLTSSGSEVTAPPVSGYIFSTSSSITTTITPSLQVNAAGITSTTAKTSISSSITSQSDTQTPISTLTATINGSLTTIRVFAASSTSTTSATSPTSSPILEQTTSLSTGAKAGIAIGCALAVLCIAIALILLHVHHRRKVLKRPFPPISNPLTTFSPTNSNHPSRNPSHSTHVSLHPSRNPSIRTHGTTRTTKTTVSIPLTLQTPPYTSNFSNEKIPIPLSPQKSPLSRATTAASRASRATGTSSTANETRSPHSLVDYQSALPPFWMENGNEDLVDPGGEDGVEMEGSEVPGPREGAVEMPGEMPGVCLALGVGSLRGGGRREAGRHSEAYEMDGGDLGLVRSKGEDEGEGEEHGEGVVGVVGAGPLDGGKEGGGGGKEGV